MATYATLNDKQYVTFEDGAKEVLNNLVESDGTPGIQDAIMAALKFAGQTKDPLVFAVAAAANAEWAVKTGRATKEEAELGNARLKTRWQIGEPEEA